MSGASSRRQALIRLGITPGARMYQRLAEACERHGIALPVAHGPRDPASATKVCSRCHQELPIVSYAVKRHASGLLQAACRTCMSELRHDHYRRNKARLKREVVDRKRAVKLRNMVRLVSYLREHPCVDCSESDPVVLEFDHVRAGKTANVTAMVHLADWSVIQREIDKCVVRCANCHRRRTLVGLGYLRAIVVQRVGHLPSKQAVTGFESPLSLGCR